MIDLHEQNLYIRWLGRAAYGDVWELQKALFAKNMVARETKGERAKNYLLLVEHPPVYTFGVRGKAENLLAQENGTDVFWVDRGGDVTFHGPGQLVGYPILSLNKKEGGLTSTAKYVGELEQLLIEAIGVDLGLPKLAEKIKTQKRFPGLWVKDSLRANESLGMNESENLGMDESWQTNANNSADNIELAGLSKIASIGVKLSRGNTMHGFALNVTTDLSWFKNIVACGIEGISVTSIKEQVGTKEQMEKSEVLEVGDLNNLTVKEVAKAVASAASRRWLGNLSHNLSIAPSHKNVSAPIQIRAKKPEWLRATVNYSANHLKLKKILRELPTVCEEAGCPNLSECWGEGTATFMINGTRCTRSCGFCLVDTRKPLALDPSEPERLASAVEDMGLNHVVITAVARDDLPDGGAGAFLKTIRAVRNRCPEVSVEVLIPDFQGDQEVLDTIFAERPEVLNHNIETCLRLQKQVRSRASYARSLAVLARAKLADLTTKSSIMVGVGETKEEVIDTLIDLGQVGVDIVTIGQYLRPSEKHIPVVRWWKPEEFVELTSMNQMFGIKHIEAGPLVRSSYMAGSLLNSNLADTELSENIAKSA